MAATRRKNEQDEQDELYETTYNNMSLEGLPKLEAQMAASSTALLFVVNVLLDRAVGLLNFVKSANDAKYLADIFTIYATAINHFDQLQLTDEEIIDSHQALLQRVIRPLHHAIDTRHSMTGQRKVTIINSDHQRCLDNVYKFFPSEKPAALKANSSCVIS